ncbi:MAG: hypothetical protein FWD28_01905 [Treponema sp.]|nr:hypothetical protein [Treponema sp.]
MKKPFNLRALLGFIFFTFVASVIYVIIQIILAPAVAPSSEITIRVKSDYILMLLQSLLGMFAIFLPNILKQKARLYIPSVMICAYAIFLFCGIILGEVRNFYHRIPHWDTILHIFSGAALGALGFSIVSLLNKSDTIKFSLSPGFVALFAFCFAVTLGVIWEIYEFSMDYFLKTNMQKYALESGELLMGQSALLDTMKDLIVDAAGAFVMSIIGYISLKNKNGWLNRLEIKRMQLIENQDIAK